MNQTGGNHERTTQFYGDRCRCANRHPSVGLHLCAGLASIAAIEAGAGLGSDQGCDDQALALVRQDVDGGPGLRWPVELYVPLLVLMWVETLHSRQMEKFISESVVARRFLDLTEQEMMHIRDHASIGRAEQGLGAEGRAEVNALIIKTAQEVGFTNGEILSSDTTVQEPAIGYPSEPAILKGWAERIERLMKKLKKRGVKIGVEGLMSQQFSV